MAQFANDWRWGLRVTPVLGVVAVLAIVFILEDPPRGQSEGAHLSPSSPREDIVALARNRSYAYTTVAFTCVTFAAGAIMWWGPEFAFLGAKAQCGSSADCEDITQADVSYRFGIVMGLSGLVGVPAGSYVSQIIRWVSETLSPQISNRYSI